MPGGLGYSDVEGSKLGFSRDKQKQIKLDLLNRAGASQGATGGKTVICGYSPDGPEVPDAYLVKIVTTKPSSANWFDSAVIGLIQEDVELKIASTWEKFVPTFQTLLAKVNAQAGLGAESLAQTFGISTQTTMNSRQIWTGTTPVHMTLTLKFNAINDGQTYREVVQPCEILMKLAAPSRISPFGTQTMFLAPPGPSPFQMSWMRGLVSKVNGLAGALNSFRNAGSETMIQFGNFLAFRSVIIKEATPSLAMTQQTEKFLPISSKIRIEFDTYQILTTEDIDAAFLIKEG